MFKKRKNKLILVAAMIILSMSAWQARGMGGLDRDEIERKIQACGSLKKKVEIAIKYSFVTEYRDFNDDTLLCFVCSNDNLELVKLLLEKGAIKGINKQDGSLRTALHAACCKDNLKMVRLLLKNGALESLSKGDYIGWRPDRLVENKDIRNLLKLFLKMQASPDKVAFIKKLRIVKKEDFKFLVKVLRGDLLVKLANIEVTAKEQFIIEHSHFNALVKDQRLTEEEKKDLERILYMEKTLWFKIDNLNLYDYMCQYAKGRLPAVYKAMQRFQFKEHVIEKCNDCEVFV